MNASAAPTATVRLAAVASSALQSRLTRPERTCILLGISEHAAWIGDGDDVTVLSDRAAVRLPNAVELAVGEIGRWVHQDDATSIGDGLISVGPLTAVVGRWFDPRPALGSCTVGDLREALGVLHEAVDMPATYGLAEALAAGDVGAILQSASALLGNGVGLTPEGDDLLAGALASHLLLADAVGLSPDYTEALAQPLSELSRARTTDFSTELLGHALAGRVAAPFADLLQAVTGLGDLPRAVDRLLAVGHTSGNALAAGLVIGGRAITQENAP